MIGDLAPRKGHFSSSPWQRHGKTVPQKEYALKGHANMLVPSEIVASSLGAAAGLNALLRIEPTAWPWAAEWLTGAEKLQLLVRVCIISPLGFLWMIGD
jgi:hypothetical protein